jgi:exopolysaccharide production protein ExoQ
MQTTAGPSLDSVRLFPPAYAREPRSWGWSLLLLWLTSPLSALLSGSDPATPDLGPGAGLYRSARYATLLVSGLALASHPGVTLTLVRSAWPLLLLTGWAALSPAWAEDPQAALHALAGAAPIWMAAVALVVDQGAEGAAAALIRMSAVACLASVATALLMPAYAVTGPRDLVGAGAVGAWRGLYLHKNILGHLAGLTVAGLASPSGGLVRPAWLRWGGLLSALVCVLLSRSRAGLVLAVACGLMSVVSWPRVWAASIAALGLAAPLAAAARPDWAGPQAPGLDHLLTLSGRMDIWRAALDFQTHPLIGAGLDAAVSPEVATELQARFGVDHVHSAPLALFLDLGAVGLGLLAFAVWRAMGGARSRAGAGRQLLVLMALGWLLSGLVEDMGVRTEGPLALMGAVALVGLYGRRARP